MAHLLITLILLAPPFLSGPKVAARLKPDSRSRTWVRGAPLPEVDTPASFLALSFMESSLFPSSSGKPLTKERAQRKLPQELSWLKGMKYPDIPVTFDPHTIKYLKWFRFNRTGRNVIRDWIEKSGKYRKMVISTLKRHHLPTALMYIALIESGYVKTTRSWAGALGLWQFMPSGTKVYGLAKSYWIDQRIDPELSTEAAMLYFADLHYRFKNWALAMGAYNCGYGRMLQSMRRYSTNDYFKLSSYENALPRETRLYVPKMQAVAIADINRKLFKIDSLKMAPPYSFEVIHLPGGVSLATLAHITGISFATLWDLNREYIRKRLPPGKGRWPVRLPPGTLARAKNRIAKQTPGWFKHSVYEVQLGDTLPSIARMFGTTT
ncbi:transglycosylase SLT domain-containing protein, partial [Myxococcota bacterium]|nr:transglycosylase SLT domain-containing protein [Myxococcota bacterium]